MANGNGNGNGDRISLNELEERYPAPDKADLKEMNKDQLAEALAASMNKNMAQAAENRMLTEKWLHDETDPSLYIAALLGGGVMGAWMGSIQKSIDDGEEGYDEDSFTFGGYVDKDLAVGLGAAVISHLFHKDGVKKEMETPGTGQSALQMSRGFRGGAQGILGGYAYRRGFAWGSEEESDEEVA